MCKESGYRLDSLGSEEQYKSERLKEWKKMADEDGEQVARDCAERDRKVDELLGLETQLVQELDAYNRLLVKFKGSARSAREQKRTSENPEIMKYLYTERVQEEYSARLNVADLDRDLVIREEHLIEELLKGIDAVRGELYPLFPPEDWTQKFTKDKEANEPFI